MNAKLQLVSGREAVDLARLARMRPHELQQLHRRMFGSDLPSWNSEQARRRIAWQAQAEREGGLPESARKHALEIAKDVRSLGTDLRSRYGSSDSD